MGRKRKEFQFLIGTVKTDDYNLAIDDVEKFQFLIGTVKTMTIFFTPSIILVVSIPHRYCKNVTFS